MKLSLLPTIVNVILGSIMVIIMTFREAIERIRPRYLIDVEGNTSCNDFEALRLATVALEKQSPRRPVYSKIKIRTNAMCPECAGSITLPFSEKLTYCSHCGQAIDWSIVE